MAKRKKGRKKKRRNLGWKGHPTAHKKAAKLGWRRKKAKERR